MGLDDSEIEAGSLVGNAVANGKVKSKEKSLSVAGDGEDPPLKMKGVVGDILDWKGWKSLLLLLDISLASEL